MRHRGVGQDSLDVVLLGRDQRGKYSGDGADPRNNQKRGLRTLNNEGNADKHVNTRCNHGRGVNQCGNRRGTFHRVRQPNVQRKLGRLADRATED